MNKEKVDVEVGHRQAARRHRPDQRRGPEPPADRLRCGRRTFPQPVHDAVRRRRGQAGDDRGGGPARTRARDHRQAARQEAGDALPAVGRRAVADGHGADLCRVPHQSVADLRARRGGRAARRCQRRPLLHAAGEDVRRHGHALPRHHPSPHDHVAHEPAVRRDDGARRASASSCPSTSKRRRSSPWRHEMRTNRSPDCGERDRESDGHSCRSRRHAVDPKPGILGSIQYALRSLGAPVPPIDELAWAIGPPLRTTFPRLLGSADRTEEAVALYRENYRNGAHVRRRRLRRHSAGAGCPRRCRLPAVRRHRQAALLRAPDPGALRSGAPFRRPSTARSWTAPTTARPTSSPTSSHSEGVTPGRRHHDRRPRAST